MIKMEQTQIDIEKAIEIVKEYFVKLKGADIEIGSRKIIDLLGFDVITAKEENNRMIIVCELFETLFSKKKEKYNFKVDMVGKITEVVRGNGSS